MKSFFLMCWRDTIKFFNMILKAIEVIISISHTKIHSSWDLKSHKLQFALSFLPFFLKSLTILGRLQYSLARKHNSDIVRISFSPHMLILSHWKIIYLEKNSFLGFPSLLQNKFKIWVRNEKFKSCKKSLSELSSISLMSRFTHTKMHAQILILKQRSKN